MAYLLEPPPSLRTPPQTPFLSEPLAGPIFLTDKRKTPASLSASELMPPPLPRLVAQLMAPPSPRLTPALPLYLLPSPSKKRKKTPLSKARKMARTPFKRTVKTPSPNRMSLHDKLRAYLQVHPGQSFTPRSKDREGQRPYHLASRKKEKKKEK